MYYGINVVSVFEGSIIPNATILALTVKILKCKNPLQKPQIRLIS